MDLRSQQRLHSQPRHETPPVATAPVQSYTHAEAPRSKASPLKNRRVLYGMAAVLAIGVLGLAAKGAASFGNSSGVLGASTSAPAVSSGKYQALFLTNGQVYFGKIIGMTADTVTMKDIYYLQQGVQNQEKKDEASNTQLQLTKLGKELHGPEDMMYVERSQVLFWENLKDDSQVVKNIKLEKEQNKN